jgi:outer membrane receptor protein involved in Fe transport
LYNRDPIAHLVFPEQGGPVGLLTLYKENRTVGLANVSYQLGRSHRLIFGGEFTRYSISGYSSLLTSLSFSNMYIEHPVRGALYAEDRIQIARASLTGGLRYDFYHSRARRPADFPRISSNPQFNPANPDAFLTNNDLFPEDHRHGYISPHMQAAIPVDMRTVVRGGFAFQAQVPDFRDILQGINTDLSVTDTRAVFGTDLDFERSKQFELGVRHSLSDHLSVDLAVYNRSIEGGVVVKQVSRFDPLRGNNNNLFLLLNDREERTRGVEVKLEQRGSMLAGWLGYAYQDASIGSSDPFATAEDRIPTPNSRPHSITGAVAVTLPSDWKPGSLTGAVLRNLELGTILRLASGTPYTPCSAHVLADATVLSPDLCSSFPTKLNDSRLPWFKQLDVRLAKRFGPSGRFAGYLDARNVLNVRNVFAVFATNGETNNPVERNANWAADSADYANEARQNNAYRFDGSMDLGVGQTNSAPDCGTWADQSGSPAAPNCVYLIRAEERFGNGDHLFDLAEQRRASDALYQVVRGPQELTGPPRRVRVGLEASF